MWKHEIMPSHSIMMFSTIEGQTKFSDSWAQALQAIKATIRQSQFFFFGDFEEQGLRNQKELMMKAVEEQYPVKKFPYNSMTFEYTVKDSYTAEGGLLKSTKRIIHLFELEDIQIFIALNYLDDGFYGFKKSAWYINPYCMRVEKATGKYFFTSPFESISSVFDEKFTQGLYSNLHDETQMALTLIDILNCHNVVTKDVVPPEKLNRKRIRNGKLPLYSYKILEVVKGKPKTKNAGSVSWDYKSSEAVRFHLCRGHFKTFTEERPLFGKYSGTFWWNPQSRGDRSKGVVEKEYSVKQA